ncbi:hypothetical protein BDFB_013718 [Asbolus verrucosus]|uniref:Phage integrase domain containing protein n=1 Tax=Asbolus verrucosus TaxID=1661398 RepID=A0A482V911_ASBVE|nr:hypothetical protein BDFB_013718 [Asbolus verrucosus]
MKKNVDINIYAKLKTFLKESVGYKPKKAQVFSRHEVTKFMSEAPDEKFLIMKVASGACRQHSDQKIFLIVDFFFNSEMEVSYLRMPHPEGYTGHSFRRSSASLLIGPGADVLGLKRHRGWRSSNAIES